MLSSPSNFQQSPLKTSQLKNFKNLNFILLLVVLSLLSSPASRADVGVAPVPIITGVTAYDGSLLVYVQPGEGAPDYGLWFYQVRPASGGESCENPLGDDSTWNTDDLGSPIRVGRLLDPPYPEMALPLINGCSYVVKVAQWIGTIPSPEFYASITGTPMGVRIFSEAELAEFARLDAIREMEELVRVIEARKTAAIEAIASSADTSTLTMQTYQLAGIDSVIPQILPELNLWLSSQDTQVRKDRENVNHKALLLRTDFYFQELSRNVNEINLQNLGFRDVSGRIVPELKKLLDLNDLIQRRDYAAIQKYIDSLNMLFKGQDGGKLSYSELTQMGMVFALPSKYKEVQYRFQKEPRDVYRDFESLQDSINRIETVIRIRVEHTADAKNRTMTLRERITSRNK